MARRPGAGALAREALGAFAAGLAVAVVLTWPLVTRLQRAAPDPFDPRFQAWTIDWVQHALGRPGLFDANIFAPERQTLAYSDSLIGIAVPLLPLRWAGLTPIGVWNVALLVGYASSAAAGYLAGRVVTGARAVGAVTGAAFAFGTFGAYEANHLQAVFHPGVATAALGTWWLAGHARAGRKLAAPAALVAASIAWQASVSFYPGAYAAVAAGVVALVRWRDLGVRGWLALVVSLALAAGATVGLAAPYLERRRALPGFGWTLADLAIGGADFARADRRLWLWGRVIPGGPFPPPVFPGATLLGLGLVGWRRSPDRRAVRLGLALTVVGAVLAVGTADTGWRRFAPYRVLYEWVPGWDALRATSRAWMVGVLGLGILAGLGAAEAARWIVVRRPTLTRATGIALVASLTVGAVLAEGYRPMDLATVGVRPVDRVLARSRVPGGVVYLPMSPQGAVAYLALLDQVDPVYRSTAHHRRMPNGYSAFTPPSYVRSVRVLRGLPGAAAIAHLRTIGVRFVVVRASARGTEWEHLFDPVVARPLRLVGRYGGELLYELP